MELIRSVFDSVGAPILVAVFLVLFVLETEFQLRRRVQNRWWRIMVNFVVSIPAFALLRILLIPAMVWLAMMAQKWEFGLNFLYNGPAWLHVGVTFLLLDYSNYIWHILLHRVPLLWRFHLVHHTDLDLDITTAFRFHFGEMIGSVIFRGGAINPGCLARGCFNL